jgi:23S rRNA pseudouridine1911/1915/1917 synthase
MIAARRPESPRLVAETGDFAVVYKPPRLHCAPLTPGEGGTLLEWYAAIFPPVMEMRGKKPIEGGLVHRLDYETQGLVLFAKNQEALEDFFAQQEQGRFVKEYGALIEGSGFYPLPPGFPPPPELPPAPPFRIASYFRPWGPGRTAVRPVSLFQPGRDIAGNRGRPYETEVIRIGEPGAGRRCFTLRIARGFRHQIRCHLAWIGSPIAGDLRYGPGGAAAGPAGDTGGPESAARQTPPDPGGNFLALRAQALFFLDPCGGRPLEFRIAPIED